MVQEWRQRSRLSDSRSNQPWPRELPVPLPTAEIWPHSLGFRSSRGTLLAHCQILDICIVPVPDSLAKQDQPDRQFGIPSGPLTRISTQAGLPAPDPIPD